jgi:hypothetical protein
MTLSKACPVVRTTSTQEYSQYLRPLRGCDITASQYGYETTSSQRMPRPCAGLKNKQVRQCSIPRDMPITRVPIYASIFLLICHCPTSLLLICTHTPTSTVCPALSKGTLSKGTIVSISISKKQQLSPTVSIELLARYGHLHYNHRPLQLMMRMNIQYWCATRLPLQATHIINWLPPIDNPSILTPTELRNSHSHPGRTSNGTSEHHVMILNGHVASLVSIASGGGRCAHCGEPGAWAYVCEGAWSEWLGRGGGLRHWRHIVISVVRLVSIMVRGLKQYNLPSEHTLSAKRGPKEAGPQPCLSRVNGRKPELGTFGYL